MATSNHPGSNKPLPAEIGFGELSISAPPSQPFDHKHAAGVWAMIGTESEVGTVKAVGLQATAAVVAYGGAQAVWAESTVGPAVTATSKSGIGVHGISTSGTGIYGSSSSQAGVVGESQSVNGVYGISHTAGAAAVAGRNLSTAQGKLAGYFDGDVEVTGDIRLVNADCAEDFTVCGDSAADPGTVMVLAKGGGIRACDCAYDKRVAGVVSGAGNYRPGIVLDRQTGLAQRTPVALLGKVYCKVDAGFGAVEIGDLLTTSQTSGHAMRAAEPLLAFGSILGKALQPLEKGRGLIPILVALQ
jgi:hypothetical protein